MSPASGTPISNPGASTCGLIIAAAASGSGKTTLTLGLLRLLARQPHILDVAFQQSTGLIPQEIRDGTFFSRRVPYYFQRACDILRSARVEIIDVPAPATGVLTERTAQPNDPLAAGRVIGEIREE